MKKRVLLFVNALLISITFHVNAQTEADYTVPSWTLYQRALMADENLKTGLYWINDDFSSFAEESDYVKTVDNITTQPESVTLERFYANFETIDPSTCNDDKQSGVLLRIRGYKDGGYASFTVQNAGMIRIAIKAKSSSADRTAAVLINGEVAGTYTELDANHCVVFEKEVNSATPVTVIVRGNDDQDNSPICINRIQVSKYDSHRDLLVSKDMPYNINTTINGNPSQQMGATWYTNAGVTDGKLQLVKGKVTDASAFESATEVEADIKEINDLIYIADSKNNDEIAAASGFEKGTKRSYVSHKALMKNLDPGTTYSYRVGGVNGAWSEIGTFTTANGSKDAFEFIYIADTQANTDEMFGISKKTVEKAVENTPDARFLVCAGDFVETYHIPGYEAAGYSGSAEWEWEQWFERMQSSWLHLPIVPVQGNHDISPTSNWHNHFNTDESYNASQTEEAAKTNMEGTVYSFVYGDALFMVINYENIPLPYAESDANNTYIKAIADWMRAQVDAHPEVKWKIASYHKSMFTGSNSHQDDGDGRFVRENMAPVFSELGIDLALQGHDHIYEVVGVLKSEKNGATVSFSHLSDAVSDQTSVEPTPADGQSVSISVTGKEGGTYDVTTGTVYFLNNSAGKKKYYPRSKEQMENAIDKHNVENYFDMFNKFGQTGEPTYSKVSVSSDEINVSTYAIDSEGNANVFDSFKLVKDSKGTGIGQVNEDEVFGLYPSPAVNNITINLSEQIDEVKIYSTAGAEILSQRNANNIHLSPSIPNGIYMVSVRTVSGKMYTERFIVKK